MKKFFLIMLCMIAVTYNNSVLPAADTNLNTPWYSKVYSGISNFISRSVDTIKANVMRTRAGFHISREYNKLMYGSRFTFHRIAGDGRSPDSPSGNASVIYDYSGNIISINDGKKAPLLLSSIPDSQDHIDLLRTTFNHQGPIDILTLNEQWEIDAVGLSTLVKNNNQLRQFHYTTPDFGAPSFIDLIRSVRDLENRDRDGESLAVVHCKAGRGRSATVVAAYLAHVIYKADGTIPTFDQILKYLKTRRSQVSLHKPQREVVSHFIKELADAKSFEALYEKYKTAAAKRDQEVKPKTK